MSNPQETQGAQTPNDELARLLPALRALAKSVEKQMYSGMTEGTGGLAVRQYRALHGRIAALMPDDYYIISVLTLEEGASGEQADDQTLLAQTHLLLQQLVTYLNQIVPTQRPNVPPGTPLGAGNVGGSWQNFGRELNDQIAQLARSTVRRALESIDFNVPTPPTPPVPPVPPVPPQNVNLSGGSIFVQPPVPPEPPNRPPNSPSGRIHIRVENGEDVFERDIPPDVGFWRGNPPPTDPPGDEDSVV